MAVRGERKENAAKEKDNLFSHALALTVVAALSTFMTVMIYIFCLFLPVFSLFLLFRRKFFFFRPFGESAAN